jgi:hypothetical protein
MSTNANKHSLFPYIAEHIFKDLIEESPELNAWILKQFGWPESSSLKVFHQVAPFFNSKKMRFDGMHRIDLLLVVDRRVAFPIEVKVGNNSPSLEDCSLSHKDTCIKGNMLSILGGLLPEKVDRAAIMVSFPAHEDQEDAEDFELPLIHASYTWGVIARKKVIDQLKKKEFKYVPNFLDIQEICKHAGGEAVFNDAVSKHLLSVKDSCFEWLKSE